MKKALIAGSTGLIGGQLLNMLLHDGRYERVIALSRQPLNINHPRLANVVTDLDTLSEYSDELIADDVFCCLGTTMKKAKSKEAFRRVDFDYPLALAQLAKTGGAECFCLVSAMGADPQSSIFYNQVKGEIENAIRSLRFDRLHIFRPSLLFGPRQEQRTGEDAAKFVFKYFGFLIPAKYKAIDAERVAKAMLTFANDYNKGAFVHESASMQKF